MKRLTLFMLALFAILQFRLFGQVTPCSPNGPYSSPGFYPKDTIELIGNLPFSKVVDFAFPNDTMIFGNTIPFDSFRISGLNNLQPGMQWQCNTNHPSCSYFPVSGQLANGCMTIFGSQTARNPSFPNYDTLFVMVKAWVNWPSGGTPLPEWEMPLFYRVMDFTNSRDSGLPVNFAFEISPNPLSSSSIVSFHLQAAANVRLSVLDMLGNEVAEISNEMMDAGKHEISMDDARFKNGLYLFKIDIDKGTFTAFKKVLCMP